jgi:hypothetical protein
MKKLFLLAGIVAAFFGIRKMMQKSEEDEFAPYTPAEPPYAPTA